MTLDALDNTIYELIRLELVLKGYLPDITLYTTDSEFEAAKQALIDSKPAGSNFRVINLHNVGGGEARGESKYPKILIDRQEEPTGNLGGAGIEEYIPVQIGGDDRFKKITLPTRSSDVIYEVSTGTETREYEVIMDTLIRNALKNLTQHKVFVDGDGFTGDAFFLEREQKIDLSTSEMIEKQIRFRASDLWLEDAVESVESFSPILEIDIDACPVDKIEEE